MAVYAPAPRVDLEQWCKWNQMPWEKICQTVGSSFRIPSHNENTYTMAATATLRLILQNNIDPGRIGFLGLGTESSTDNSAGSVIVRGMVDQALTQLRVPQISRNCEVPEFKHGCLSGVYALKCASRYAAYDGVGRLAIAVASDVAEYELGSLKEQAQGAGAVAMLVEQHPKLFSLDLCRAGSGSHYRGPDLRKPHKRHFVEGYGNSSSGKLADTPVFSGPYSTMSYLDEVTVAVEDMLSKLNTPPGEYYSEVAGLFFHRPYSLLPVVAMSVLYTRGLARATSAQHKRKFEELCQKARVPPEAVVQELHESLDLFHMMLQGNTAKPMVLKATQEVAAVLRNDREFIVLLDAKMSLGCGTMNHFGNLASAALPCWMAAGLEEAAIKGLKLDGRPMVMVGYGSGDAAEAIPIGMTPGWESAAKRIGAARSLEAAVDLTQDEYEGLHSGEVKRDFSEGQHGRFVIDHVGTRHEAEFQDLAVEYYKYIA